MGDPARKMSLVQATMLVAGNMIGTGVFLLPVNLASVGGIAVFGWLVATAGAAALGLIFAKLGELDPQEGGPYAYARDFLGPYVGFQTNYIAPLRTQDVRDRCKDRGRFRFCREQDTDRV